ncbi:hypothetical protein C7974DRAFT_376035 [Boeremia exigua]|uniref:uncharacterized protein n=1 Tax=Boeremia exigua TaxID=749465 RepID=UPI001E8E73B8|nr:uncharacterized protein C7974DRAFT_376035 [Boeremia exigua]KAH6629156.1 hypothetical protein C7974DRAFT_376035 [Boeremia exigua]
MLPRPSLVLCVCLGRLDRARGRWERKEPWSSTVSLNSDQTSPKHHTHFRDCVPSFLHSHKSGCTPSLLIWRRCTSAISAHAVLQGRTAHGSALTHGGAAPACRTVLLVVKRNACLSVKLVRGAGSTRRCLLGSQPNPAGSSMLPDAPAVRCTCSACLCRAIEARRP